MNKLTAFVGCLVLSSLLSASDFAIDSKTNKKENIIDFSVGVIEGELNRPSMLMELGNDFKDLNDIVHSREDFYDFQQSDSKFRFRYIK